MLALRYLSGRIIKIFGNAMKGPFYVFHWIAPNKRFSIPHHSRPLINWRSRHKIPKIIWQTNYTDRVTLAVYVNYLFNRLISPTYEYRFLLDPDRVEFIREQFPHFLEQYERLQIGAARADFWRILAIQKNGGVYLDIDAHVVWPLGFIIPRDNEELYLVDRNKRWSNCFFASVPNNPHLDAVMTRMIANMNNPDVVGVIHVTGPAVFEYELKPLNLPSTNYRYTCFQGTFTNEFFQYIDHPQGKYTKAQGRIKLLKDR